MTGSGEQDGIETIYDALDRGDAEHALQSARAAIDATGEDPILRFLAGVALLDLERAEEAIESLRRAVELDPDDAEFRTRLGQALYHACRFEAARTEARKARELDDKLPETHELLGLLAEAEGRFAEAERHFARAGALDPESFPPVHRLDREEFEEVVRRAGERLPETYRQHLQQVAVSVEPVPPREILHAEQPPLDPALLGLFVGVSLPERTHFSPGGELPPRIYLFQRNLERWAGSAADLEEQIAITLYHELGHYLGLDEGELAEIDLA